MSHDTLAIIWFGLWGVIWAVYFILDAYALGNGMIFPFVTKDRKERNQLQEAIGPFWGGNEVWLITAGGATFAAFPITYANMFSYLYTPFFLLLIALFARAAGLEFMHKDDSPLWQKTWKWAYAIGSFLIAFLFGVTFANLYYGLEIGKNGYEGNLLSLLNHYGILGGIFFTVTFILSGALWVMIKTDGDVAKRSYKIAKPVSIASAAILAIFYVATANRTNLFQNSTEYPVLFILPLLAMVASVITIIMVNKKKIGFAFTSVCTTIALFMATGFAGMYPRMLPSRINDEYSTTLFEAAGSHLNLKIMFFVALVMVPIVIGYQLWSYTIFKEKIHKDSAKGYH
ncbi:cytochrome C oxidase assembly protein [Bacillus manliponensis]|uniref:Cytochrome C oxidase assembly protein n=1 Tax=Bacillus manliponensis TaxID=574376 RepID=A0A073JTX8_9BACI|nr:cytochrome d ubiquinol oxidase subunit II [Bacillus manliponensis]KEK17646.1 cytochrome C oxidase assembly protein [Bacillus manliponensis]